MRGQLLSYLGTPASKNSHSEGLAEVGNSHNPASDTLQQDIRNQFYVFGERGGSVIARAAGKRALGGHYVSIWVCVF